MPAALTARARRAAAMSGLASSARCMAPVSVSGAGAACWACANDGGRGQQPDRDPDTDTKPSVHHGEDYRGSAVTA